MKRLILLIPLLATSLAGAQAPAIPPKALIDPVPNNLRADSRNAVLLPGLNLPMVVQPGPAGNFDFTTTDIGKLMDRQMVEHFRRNQEDAVFFKDQLVQLEKMFMRYNELITAPGPANSGIKTYADMVNDSVSGNFPKVDQFLAVRSQILALERGIIVRIGSLKTMSNALPSARVAVTQTKDVELPAQLNLNFDKIAAFYEGQLSVVGEYLKTMSLSFFDKIGNKVDVVGLNFDKNAATLITKDEASKRTAQIVEMRKDSVKAWGAQDKFVREVIKNAKQILQLRGVDDRGRLTVTADKEERDAKVNRLFEAGLYMSYMRLKYRSGVGSFYVDYKPLSFNRDQLKFDPIDYVTKFSDESVRNRTDVEKAVTNFQRAVFAGKVRQGEADTFLIGTVLYTWDLVRGWSQLSKLGLQIFGMLYADAKEEIMMSSGEGVENFSDMFQKRYLSTPEAKARTKTALCSIDASQCPAGKASASTGGIDANGSMIGLASEAMAQTQLRMVSIKQAADLQRTLDELTNVPMSVLGQTLDRNVDILK